VEITERIVRVEAYWVRMGAQLNFIRKIEQLLDEQLRISQYSTIQILNSKFDIALQKLESVVRKKAGNAGSADEEMRIKRWKYARVKESIDKIIQELRDWQDIFDPSWFLIMKAAIPQIDIELQRYTNRRKVEPLSAAQSLRTALVEQSTPSTPIFLPENRLNSIHLSDIPFCSTKVGERTESSTALILDTVKCPVSANIAMFKNDVRDLARKLSHSDPLAFGLLNCKGVVTHIPTGHMQPNSFTLVLRIPKEFSEPKNLRNYLLKSNFNHSLSDRFQLAVQLARSVSYIHAFGFVHKNIRPETILIFRTKDSSIGSVSLVGFENFRTVEGRTLRSGDDEWEKNLYRPPARRGSNPIDDYIMQHDIYSLGVCLLELGLWESFIVYDEGQTITSPSNSLDILTENNGIQNGQFTKDYLVSLARERLPKSMGDRYSSIVETCLTCLDPDNVDFGDEHEFMDADGILVGVRYIEKVWRPQTP
jgi:serine/threonine protein kinase